MSIEERLQSLGYDLPQAVRPLASYVPAVRTGTLVFSSGQVPMRNGELPWKGKVGRDVSQEDAVAAARQCALNCLAAIKTEIDSLDQVVRVVRLTGYVNSAEDFINQPAVVNGASDLLLQVFGDAGKHSRAAIGVAQLPLGAPVEVDIVVEVRA